MPVMLPTGNVFSSTSNTIMPTEMPTSQGLTREQFDAASMKVYNRVNETNIGVSPWEHVARWGAGTIIDTADSLWSSPLNPMGDRGDVWSMADDGTREYYERNKDLIEGSSAVVGGIGIAVAAEALVVPRIAGALASSTALTGSALWRSTRAWNVMSKVNMMRAQKAAAEAGEAYGLFSTPTGRSFLANRVAAGVGTTTRTMPIEYGLMWNNEAFNSGDWSKEGFWIGVGAAAGGAIGVAGARAATRQIANSPEIRNTRMQPYVMAGMSNDLLSSDHLQTFARLDPNAELMKESAYTTEYLIGSRSANPKGYEEAAENATRLNKMRDEFNKLAVDSVQKIVTQGVPGVDTWKLSAKQLPEIRNIVDTTAKSDPFLFHGMASGGILKGSVKEATEARAKHIEGLAKQSDVAALAGNIKEAQRLNREQRVLKMQDENILVNHSWMSPDSELAKAVAEHQPAQSLAALERFKGVEMVKIHLPTHGNVTLDASLKPLRDNGKSIKVESMQLKDRLQLDEVAKGLVTKLSRKDAKVHFQLNEKSAKDWYSVDLAAEILDRGGKIDVKLKNMNLANADDMRRHSLRIKARAVLQEVGELGKITPEMRFKYNLPAPTSMERLEDSAGDGFRQWLTKAASDEGSAFDLQQMLMDYRAIQGIDLMPPQGAPRARLDGDMLSFNRDKKGEWMRPMIGYFDQRSQIQKVSEGGHSTAVMLRKAIKTKILAEGNTHVSQLARTLIQMPELAQAMDIKGIHSDQITGLGGGLKQAIGEFLPRRFRLRDNATMLAATKLQEATERHGLAHFAQQMESVGMQQAVTRITSSGHAPQRAALDQYFSLRSGWDLDNEAIPIGDNMFGFVLKDTDTNRRRLGMGANEAWDDYALMPNERLGKPIAVDGDSLEIIKAYNQLTDNLRTADNVLRKAKGLKDIEHRSFYVAPPDTRGKFVGFVFDPSDKLVPGRTIVASTPDEYKQIQKRTLNELGKNSGYTIRDRDQLTTLRDVWDEAQMDWIDPGVSSATGGLGTQKGGLTGAYVKQGAFMEALDWVKRKSVIQSQDTLASLMDDTLQVNRAFGVTEASVSGGLEKAPRNIYDEYEAALTGGSARFSSTAIGDKILRGAEKSIDRVLQNTAITYPARYVIDLAQRIGMDPTDLNGVKTYQKIADAMGPYTPYASAMDFMASRGVTPPPTVKGISTKLNSMAANVMLRWFELPHALVNGLGIIATMPSAVFGGKAPISSFVTVKGDKLPFVDGMRIMADSMKDMYSKRGSADWAYMVKMGDAGQSVLEYHQQLGAVNSQAGFFKWAKQLDKWAGILGDTSENWSRQSAHFVGLRLADYHGLEGMAARHNFAREVANSMIADYAPINRPELFGSGMGSMIGLFQSYALNQYTKMFRWMEQGEYAKMGIQAAVQATMFGVPGTYGMGTLMDLRDSLTATGSEPTALDEIYKHYGPVLGGAIAHGGISELTQLGLWTRGDTNFRIPGASGTLAPLDVGTKVARGFVDGVSAYLNAMPGEGTHAMMEVVQREMPNRVLKSWLTLANGGKEIDAYGMVMNETQTWMDTVARVVGVRSSRQQSEVEAYYAGKMAMDRDANRMEKVRESFRAAVRNNKGDASAISPIQYYNDYVKAGGNPRQFKTWVRNALRDADSPRSLQTLKQSMGTTRSALETWRFGAYGAVPVE